MTTTATRSSCVSSRGIFCGIDIPPLYMSEIEKLAGVKRYLRRTKTPAELETLADACYSEATETVTITSIGAEGTNSAGQVSFPKWLLLAALEEILEEGIGGRQLGDVLTRNQFSSPV